MGAPRKTATPRIGTFTKVARAAPKIKATGSSSSRITIHTGGGALPSPVFGAAEAISGTPTSMRFAIHWP